MLREVLHTLQNDHLSNSAADIEIIVADDCSTDGTYSMIEEEFPTVILVKGRGKSALLAKRSGIEASTGDYIVAMDDDALPKPGWIKEVIPALNRGEKLVQSKIVFRDLGQDELHDESPVYFRTGFKLNMYPYSVNNGGAKEQYLHNCQECGLFISRDVLSAIPLDDPNLAIDFGEAASFFIRVTKCGYKVFFQPTAVINHLGADWGGCKERDGKIAPKKKVTPYTTGMIHNFFIFARMYKPMRIPYMIGYYISAGIFLSIKQKKNCLPFFLKGIAGGLTAKIIPTNKYSWGSQ